MPDLPAIPATIKATRPCAEAGAHRRPAPASRRSRAVAAWACARVHAATGIAQMRSTRLGAPPIAPSAMIAWMLERLLVRPRHIEVQIFGDMHGTVVAPRRARMLDPATAPESDRGIALPCRYAGVAPATQRGGSRGGKAAGYVNAGTVEFLLDQRWRFLFPRDEHAPASRASRHRGCDGLRSRPSATGNRGGRTAALRAGRSARSPATPSSAASTPKTRSRTISRKPAPSPP